MKAFTSSLILICSCAFVLILAACVQSGVVTQFTLQETRLVGGQTTQGQVTVQVTPANFHCQNLACPVLVESSNPAVAAVQGGLDFGASNARVVFADGTNASFTVTTQPVTSTTDVTFTTSFLVCLQKRDVVSMDNCQPIGERKQATLQVAPQPTEGLFTCEDKFAIDKPDKPPLSLDGLKPPSDFKELPLNPTEVIGFHFLKTDAALLVQPVQAPCKFTKREFGVPLGVVWKIDENSQSTAYVVTLNLESANKEVADGALFDEKGPKAAIHFTVTQLKPRETATKAQPIDVSIRANAVCFRVDDRRYCSSGGDQHELSVRDQFPNLYKELVQAQLADTVQVLQKRELLHAKQVDLDNGVSEIEDRKRIEDCSPQKPDSCHPDLLAAATITQRDEAQADERELGVLEITADIELDSITNTLPVLPVGQYVVYSMLDAQQQITLPIKVRGVTAEGKTIDEEVPAEIMPYIEPTGTTDVVEVYGIGFRQWVCLFWERCGFIHHR